MNFMKHIILFCILNIMTDIFKHPQRKNGETKARRSRGMRRTLSYAAMTKRGVTNVCEVMALCIVLILVGCAKRPDGRDSSLPKEIENNPVYKFALIFDKSLSEEIKNQIRSDIQKIPKVEIMSKDKLDYLLEEKEITWDALMKMNEVDFSLRDLSYIAIFSHKNGKIYLHGLNFLSGIVEEVSVDYELKEKINWLRGTRSGWIYFDSDPYGAEVFVDYNIVGYTPLLKCFKEGSYDVDLIYKGYNFLKQNATIPSTTYLYGKVDPSYVKKEDEFGMTFSEKMQAGFVAIVTISSIALAIILPIAL